MNDCADVCSVSGVWCVSVLETSPCDAADVCLLPIRVDRWCIDARWCIALCLLKVVSGHISDEEVHFLSNWGRCFLKSCGCPFCMQTLTKTSRLPAQFQWCKWVTSTQALTRPQIGLVPTKSACCIRIMEWRVLIWLAVELSYKLPCPTNTSLVLNFIFVSYCLCRFKSMLPSNLWTHYVDTMLLYAIKFICLWIQACKYEMGVAVSVVLDCQGSLTETVLTSSTSFSLFVHSHTGYKYIFVVKLASRETPLSVVWGKSLFVRTYARSFRKHDWIHPYAAQESSALGKSLYVNLCTGRAPSQMDFSSLTCPGMSYHRMCRIESCLWSFAIAFQMGKLDNWVLLKASKYRLVFKYP